MLESEDITAMQEQSSLLRNMRPVMVADCPDKRCAELLELFNKCDERGRVTLLRLAQVIPKNDSIKEICR